MSGFSVEVTPVILTRDEAPNIGRTLGQLRWARDIILVDSESTDETVPIAQAFPNVRVFSRPFDDHASQWLFGCAQARTRWLLTLDADYFTSAALAAEIDSLAPPPDVDAYEARFVYAVGGRPLRATLYPPRPVLLRAGRFDIRMDGHTQRTTVAGETRLLGTPLVHDDRKSFASFVDRQRRYMRREAEKIRGGRELPLAGRIRRLRVVAPIAVVFHALFVKGLILDGAAGLRYAWERFVAECILSRELFRRRSDG